MPSLIWCCIQLGMISHSFSVTFPVNVVSLNVERCNTVQKMARQLGFDNASASRTFSPFRPIRKWQATIRTAGIGYYSSGQSNLR